MKSDSQILQNVLQELRWDHRVGEGEVGVEVNSGVVTLSGTVSNYAKRLAAQEAAHRVSGVLDVANTIAVVPPTSSTITDTDIAIAVRNALTWDTFVPTEQITSTVSNGWVTLAGTVGTMGERDDAEAAIRNLDGVRGVTNTIDVRRKMVNVRTLKTSIEQALERRADREAHAIDVAVADGAVTLSGRVHSWQEKRDVLDAAGQAPGIQRVVDHLRIDPNF